MDSPVARGVIRLIVDPHSYYLCTSDAAENAQIDALVKGGKTYLEAVNIMVENSQQTK